jgi:hypothetical protein
MMAARLTVDSSPVADGMYRQRRRGAAVDGPQLDAVA